MFFDSACIVSEKMDVEENQTEKMEIDEEKVIGNYVIVDLQGYRNKHRFICKEFCLIDGNYKYHAIIKNPDPFKTMNPYYRRHAEWAIRYFHGLGTESGDVHVIEVIQKMYPKIANKKVIVRHPWKMPWLKYLFRNCGEIDCVCIENIDVNMNLRKMDPDDENGYDYCEFHNQHGFDDWRCSLFIALEMKDILDANLS